MPVSATLMEESCFPKLFAELRKIDVAETFIGRDGQLERRALQMIDEDLEVVGPNMGVFG